MGLLIYEVEPVDWSGKNSDRVESSRFGDFCGKIQWLGLFVVGGGFIDILLVVVMGGVWGEEAEEGDSLPFPFLSFLFLRRLYTR